MFDIASILGPAYPAPLTVLDIGAMVGSGLPPGVDINQRTGQSRYRVLGFEPQPEECERVNAAGMPGFRCLPHALGDGRERPFYVNVSRPTSSLLAPNPSVCDRFQELSQLMRAERVMPVQTRRLDDLAELGRVDMIKIDTQGAELMIFQHGPRVLADALVVRTEVSFVPFYLDQPLFADVDAHLRASGFAFHCFVEMAGRAFRPTLLDSNPAIALRQVLWADAWYVRDFTRLEALSPEALLRLAVVVHDHLQSHDLVLLVLREADRRGDSAFAERYFQAFRERGRSLGIDVAMDA